MTMLLLLLALLLQVSNSSNNYLLCSEQHLRLLQVHPALAVMQYYFVLSIPVTERSSCISVRMSQNASACSIVCNI
jgi:hypothetical protein